MITFGDLLTLLLCFFVTTLTTGPLSTRKEAKESKAVRPIVEPTMLSQAHGTVLASNLEESSVVPTISTTAVRVLTLNKVAFERWGGLSAEGLGKLSSFVTAEHFMTATAEVEVCADSSGAGSNVAWALSRQRVQAVYDVLVGLGVEPSNINFRAMGPHCGATGSVSDSQMKSQAHVRLVGAFVTNG